MIFLDEPQSDGKRQDIGFLLLPEFSNLCLSALFEPLRAANLIAQKNLYQWSFFSIDSLPVISSGGVSVNVHSSLADAEKLDVLIVVSGFNPNIYWSPALASYLRSFAVRGGELGGVDTGSYILARSGLLNGYQATIHWEEQSSFKEVFPNVKVVPHRIVIDRNRFSTAGATTGLDLMLRLIRRQHGFRMALEVASKFYYSGDSGPDVSHRLMLVQRLALQSKPLARAVELMHDTISAPVAIAEIARVIGVHQRTLENIYKRILNVSPVRYYLRTRLYAAQNLLSQTNISILNVALQCGFQSASAFSRAYRSEFSTSPREFRYHSWAAAQIPPRDIIPDAGY